MRKEKLLERTKTETKALLLHYLIHNIILPENIKVKKIKIKLLRLRYIEKDFHTAENLS